MWCVSSGRQADLPTTTMRLPYKLAGSSLMLSLPGNQLFTVARADPRPQGWLDVPPSKPAHIQQALATSPCQTRYNCITNSQAATHHHPPSPASHPAAGQLSAQREA